MQEKDTETVREQRRRLNRANKMKDFMMMILVDWAVLSLVLMIALFIMIYQIRSQMKDLTEKVVIAASGEVGYLNDTKDGQVLLYSEYENYEPAEPVASGIQEAENIAAESDVHKVYLTFEDGPTENTAAILDILKEKGVKATFFVTGQHGQVAHDIYKRIVEEGHTLGMHSYSNKYSTIYQSEDKFEEDLSMLRVYLLGVTGVEPIYYRFPGGSSNQITNVPMENFIHYLNKEGLVYFDWNVLAGEPVTNECTKDEMVANVTGDVVKYKTSVVLMHDGEESSLTVEALPEIIDELLLMNAEILPIDEKAAVIQHVKADTVK